MSSRLRTHTVRLIRNSFTLTFSYIMCDFIQDIHSLCFILYMKEKKLKKIKRTKTAFNALCDASEHLFPSAWETNKKKFLKTIKTSDLSFQFNANKARYVRWIVDMAPQFLKITIILILSFINVFYSCSSLFFWFKLKSNNRLKEESKKKIKLLKFRFDLSS